MKEIKVGVKRDHLQTLATSKKPIDAVIELIWNALDADADQVSIRVTKNVLSGLESICVSDNGIGISYQEADSLFGNLGGSWKTLKFKSQKGRNLHGKSGKGRFRAFALGSDVEWLTTCVDPDGKKTFVVKGSSSNLERFHLKGPEPSSGSTGTEVTITNIHKDFISLTNENASQEIARSFAVYLSEYPGIRIDYDGTIINPSSVQHRSTTLPLGSIQVSHGYSVTAELTIIEWTFPQERILYLCDEKGVALHNTAVGIQAPGYQFTAYLKSDFIRDMDKKGTLDLDELNPDIIALVDAARPKLKEYFRQRASEDSSNLVKEWKDDKIYPYEGEPADLIERTERQVFDVVAVSVNSYLTDFDSSTSTNKRFTFNLIKQALKENPESLQKIFDDVLRLPKERQDDLAKLLKKTSLSALISSAKIIADRLDFIRGLHLLVFEKESKDQLLERDQLHKIIETETWIFGEQFHLTNSEDTLNEVLSKYLSKLRKEDLDQSPVLREDGSTGRIDLMLARTIPQPRANEHEHLVVELKRPSKKIDTEVLSQIESYAIAVAQDERFKDTSTKWIFWAVSNEMTDEARKKARQRGRPEGLVYDDAEQRITVWAKTWAQVLDECSARLDFFKKRLEYEADRDSAREYLIKTYEKYLPSSTKKERAADVA